MKYFKNTELAQLYKISEKSVRNWIDAAKQNKLDLDLYEEDGKTRIANTSKNTRTIEDLVKKGKKYKNTRGFHTVAPSSKFYETYDQKQTLDIISSLTIHHELPLKYNYVEDDCADYWDKYTQRLSSEESPNMLTSTTELIRSNLSSIDRLLGGHKQINIIDLGPGNGMAARDTLEHLVKQNRLRRYIAIDVSHEMLQIAEANVKEWFGDRVKFEGHVRDFSYERFDDLLVEDYIEHADAPPLNVVFFVGGTLCNFRSQDQSLQAINDSLSPNDLIIYGTKLDTANSRRYFDFNAEKESRPVDYLFRTILELLNIDQTLYEVDQFFDKEKKARFICVRPKVAILIKFDLGKSTKTVELAKNEPIVLWRYWHQDAIEVIGQFDKNHFDLMHASKSLDREYLLLVSKIKTDITNS